MSDGEIRSPRNSPAQGTITLLEKDEQPKTITLNFTSINFLKATLCMSIIHTTLNSSSCKRTLPLADLLCACWVHDTNTGALLDANLAALKLYGYDRSEFLSLSVDGLRDAHEHRHLDIYLDAGAAVAVERRQVARPMPHWMHRTKSGDRLAVTLSAKAIDWDGRPARLVFVNDVTALHAARLESKLLRRCMECQAEGEMIFVMHAGTQTNARHHIIYVNRAFEQHTGYGRTELIGRDADMFHGPLTNVQELERMHTAMARGESVMVELWQYGKREVPHLIEMTITPVADERGWIEYWISSCRKISGRALS